MRTTGVTQAHAQKTVRHPSKLWLMILLYLHRFSFIDLDQKETPPRGRKLPIRFRMRLYLHVCERLSWYESIGWRKKYKKSKPLSCTYRHMRMHTHVTAHSPLCWGISSSCQWWSSGLWRDSHDPDCPLCAEWMCVLFHATMHADLKIHI